MRKLVLLFLIMLAVGCGQKTSPYFQEAHVSIEDSLMVSFDSIYKAECRRLNWTSDDTSKIAWICAFEKTALPLTEEEIAYWDSVNEEGSCVIIRDAERDLDTIINHLRYSFAAKKGYANKK